MARQYDFGKNQILRPEFLNSLQDVLSSYLDMLILSYSGNEVVAEATTDSPIVITIDGKMRSVPSSLTGVVSGLTGTKDVFVVLRSAAVTLEAFDRGEIPEVSAGEAYRQVGTCYWDGSLVTGVHTFSSLVNANQLSGRGSSYEPAPYNIPVSDDSGRLHPDWFPAKYSAAEPIGTVKGVWVPTDSALPVASAWVVMQGQVLTPTEHSFFGVGTVTIPDMRNKFVIGADAFNPYGSTGLPSSLSSAAPGMGGHVGSNEPHDASHTHVIAGHSHLMGAHEHVASHLHSVSGHQHSIPLRSVLHQESPNTVHEERGGFGLTNSSQSKDTTYASLTTTHGLATQMIGYNATQISSTAVGELDVRPAHVGLVYMLKVH